MTATPSASALGSLLFDGTAAQTLSAVAPASYSELGASNWSAVSFAVNESDPSCGPGRWSLTGLVLAVSQASAAVTAVQVQIFVADVSRISFESLGFVARHNGVLSPLLPFP